MDEKSLKTSTKQRIVIAIIAILLLGSTIAAYVAIVVSSGNSGNNNSKLSKLEQQYTEKQTEITNYAATLSNTYFTDFSSYRSRVKAFNAEAANSVGIQKTDLKEGTGRELVTDDIDYFAYYIGWCPDESVFDSSFDDYDNPTSLKAPLYAGQGLIEGWNEGVIGMKIGGVREIQMPGELAYGTSREICGTTNSALKFIIMPITDQQLSVYENELETIYAELISAYYSQQSSSTNSSSSNSSSSNQ